MSDPFDSFMGAVDEVLLDLVGCVSLDLPDIDYRALYDEGVSPADVAAGLTQDLEAGMF